MTDKRPEIIALNKYLKNMFPIIMEVSNYSVDPFIGGNSLTISIAVSPEHFCELFFNEDIERKVIKHMRSESSQLIKSIITEWDCNKDILFTFQPYTFERSVLKTLNLIL